MNTEVNTQQAGQKRVYSDDKKLYIGMTVREAAKSQELMEIFDFADIDGNGELDKGEIDRYNSPLFVENVKTQEARVIGKLSGRAGRGSLDGKLDGMLIKDNEIDFYPGLTIEKVNAKARQVFTQIDTNHDGEIQKEEVEEVVKIKQKADDTKKEIDKILSSYNKRQGISVSSVFAGPLVSGVAFVTGVLTGPIALAALAVAGVAAVGAAGYSVYNYIQTGSQLNQLVDKLEQEFGNHPYTQEHHIIEDLRAYIDKKRCFLGE